MRLGVGEGPARDAHVRRHRHRGLRRDQATVDRRGHRDDLVDAARLVDVLGGAVLQSGRIGGGDLVGVVTGRVHHREDVPGVRNHGHDAAAVGVGRAHGLGQRLLRGPLDVAVEGQPHARARHRVGFPTGRRRDHPPGRVDLDPAQAVCPAQHPIVGAFDAAAADDHFVVTDRGEPDDVGCERAGRVEAPALLQDADARQPQVGHGLAHRRVQAPGQVGETSAAGEFRLQGVGGHAEQRREGGGHGLRVSDVVRVGVDRARLDVLRQRRSAAVGDDTADRGQRHRPQPLLLGAFGVGGSLERLQLGQPTGEHDQRRAENDDRHPQPAARATQPHGRPGRGDARRRPGRGTG